MGKIIRIVVHDSETSTQLFSGTGDRDQSGMTDGGGSDDQDEVE